MAGFVLTIRRLQHRDPFVRDVTYTLSGTESEKLLELIRRVQREADPTVPYRAGCCTGKCGTCTVQVDGRPHLSCQTMLEPGSYLLESPKGWLPVRGLVGTRVRPDPTKGGN